MTDVERQQANLEMQNLQNETSYLNGTECQKQGIIIYKRNNQNKLH
jgi:hypothetical protein